MNYTEKMEINAGLLFWAFGYVLEGENAPAAAFALLGLVMALAAHSLRGLEKHFGLFLGLSLGQLFLLYGSSLPVQKQVTGLVIVCNTAAALLWSESSRHSTAPALHLLFGGLGVLAVLTLLVPETFLYEGCRRAGCLMVLGWMGLPYGIAALFSKASRKPSMRAEK